MKYSIFRTLLPMIHAGISRTHQEALQEHISAGDYYDYLGDEKTAPRASYLIHGIVPHPTLDNEDGYGHVRPDGSILKLKSLNSAKSYSDMLHHQYNKSLSSAHELLSNHYSDITDDKSVNVVHKYTGTSAVDVNKRLITGQLKKGDTDLIKGMDQVLHQHGTPDSMTVYSGTNKQHAGILRAHDQVNHPGYLSTSISLSSARSFAAKNGGDILAIHIPQGHPGAYVSHLSKHDGEKEFILPRNSVLHIDRSKEKVLVGPYGTYKVHHATLG
jgi:ADP-ribosyltransferase exoenzyme